MVSGRARVGICTTRIDHVYEGLCASDVMHGGDHALLNGEVLMNHLQRDRSEIDARLKGDGGHMQIRIYV